MVGLLGLLVAACNAQDAPAVFETESSPQLGAVRQALCGDNGSVQLPLLQGSSISNAAIGAWDSVQVRSGGQVQGAAIVNLGSNTTLLENDATVHSIISEGPVLFHDRVTVEGLVQTTEPISAGSSPSLNEPLVNENAMLTTAIVHYIADLPTNLQPGVTIDSVQALPPGSYGDTVIINGTLQVSAGTYRFSSLSLNGSIEVTSGPVVIWVDDDIVWNGNVLGTNPADPEFLLIGATLGLIRILNPLNGFIMAPGATLELQGNGTYRGAYFANRVDVFPNLVVEHRSFVPETFFASVTEIDPLTTPTCSDATHNGLETDQDCGGPECSACSTGSACIENADCTSGACVAQSCQASGTGQFTFESGAEGWNQFVAPGNGTSVATSPVFQGSGSLRFQVAGSGDPYVFVPLIAPPAAGTTVTYHVFVPVGAPVIAVQPFISSATFVWSETWHSFNPSTQAGSWQTYTQTFDVGAATPASELGVKFYLNGSYTGPLYVDSITW